MSLEILAIVGVIIILGLSAVAAYYLLQLRKLRQSQQAQREALEAQQREQRDRTLKSLRILADAILGDQLTLTEGALRVRALLVSLDVNPATREQFSAFFLLADATQHIPILEEWKKLDRKEQRRFDLQRLKLEDDHREFVIDAAKRLKEFLSGEGSQSLYYSAG